MPFSVLLTKEELGKTVSPLVKLLLAAKRHYIYIRYIRIINKQLCK